MRHETDSGNRSTVSSQTLIDSKCKKENKRQATADRWLLTADC
jgi:hypothetical protein